MARVVVLVGLMGSGKTAVGRRLAARIGASFRDTDDLVVERAGKSVRQIFADAGEETFRVLESAALTDVLAARGDVVIAAAGGVVLSATNRAAIQASASHVVWLDADVATLGERTRHGAHRPLLDGDAEGRLGEMRAARSALYGEIANHRVDTTGKSIDDVVTEVASLIELEPAS